MTSNRPRQYASRAEIKRIVAAVREAGIAVEVVEVTPDGTIRVMSADAKQAPPEDAYEKWSRENPLEKTPFDDDDF